MRRVCSGPPESPCPETPSPSQLRKATSQISPSRRNVKGPDPDRRRRASQERPRAIPRVPTSQHDTLGTLPGRAWAALLDPEGRQRFGGLAVGLHRGDWRPILARIRRADGRWYGRPGEAEGRGRGAEIFELADAVGSLRGQPVCRGMYGRATDGNGRLLSPGEVARVCGLSRRAVYRAIPRGELRAARLCNRSAFTPPSWSGGSASRRSRPRLQRRRGRACLSRRPRREACGRCSTGPMRPAETDRER